MSIRIPIGPSGQPVAWATIDIEDYERVAAYRWYMGGRGYPFLPGQSSPTGRSIFMHRFVLELFESDDLDVDHINRDKLDNRRANLRQVSHAENVRNSERIEQCHSRREEIRPLVRMAREAGAVLHEIAEKFGIDAATAAALCDGIPAPPPRSLKWTKDTVAEAFRSFFEAHGRLPGQADLRRARDGMPCFPTVYRLFPGGFPEAREYAGFGAIDLRKERAA